MHGGARGWVKCVGRYRRPRTGRPGTPPYAAHSRERATPRPYCRAVGLRSLRLGTAGERVHLIWTFQALPSGLLGCGSRLSNRGRGGWGLVYRDGPLPSHQNSRTKSGTIVLEHSVQKYNVLIFNSGELAGVVVPRGFSIRSSCLMDASSRRCAMPPPTSRRCRKPSMTLLKGKLFTLHSGYRRG
jgi:hypothetical protein